MPHSEPFLKMFMLTTQLDADSKIYYVNLGTVLLILKLLWIASEDSSAALQYLK